MGIHSERHFIAWIIEILRDAGLTVGDGEKPASVPAGTGYVVVYSLAGGTTSGSIDSPRSDGEPNVQVTSSSERPDQCRWLADKVRRTFDDNVPATLPDGRRVIWMDFPIASMSLIRDDDVQPPRFFIPDRVAFGTV